MTPQERRASVALVIAWCGGLFAGAAGLPERLSERVQGRLHPPLPTIEALRQTAGDDTLRVRLYASSLALRALRAHASGPARAIDPNTADRGDWDRLPGIGPKTASALLEHRSRTGGFSTRRDLLDVPGIGPKTLARIEPYLDWSVDSPGGRGSERATARPRLNAVDGDFLETLTGIGPKLANSIVRERRQRRGFRDWSEVLAIEGIGQSKLEILQQATRLDTSPGGPDPEGKP